METLQETIIRFISRKFGNQDTVTIPAQRGAYFTATLYEDGIEVNNLSTQPFLPWEVFVETVHLLRAEGGVAQRGNAMNYKLGGKKLPLNSVEGHVASQVYGKEPGEWVFRRITPIAAILVWAGICENRRGALAFVDPSS